MRGGGGPVRRSRVARLGSAARLVVTRVAAAFAVALIAVTASSTAAHAAPTPVIVSANPYFVPILAGQAAYVNVASNGGIPLPFTPDLASLTVVTAPATGTLTRTDVGLRYEPPASPTQSATFQYRICGTPVGDTVDCAIVTVYVEPIALPATPVAIPAPVPPPVIAPPVAVVVPDFTPYVTSPTPAAPVSETSTTTVAAPASAPSDAGSPLAFTGGVVGRAFMIGLALLVEGVVLCSATGRRRRTPLNRTAVQDGTAASISGTKALAIS